MTELNIQRGLSTVLFPTELNGAVNPRLDKQEGCWYLCEDTAELFLCVRAVDGQLILKRINEVQAENTIDPAIIEALETEITKVKESLADYAKKSDIPSTNGLATEEFVVAKIAEAEFGGADIDVTSFATKDEIKNLASTSYVDEQIAGITHPTVDLAGYATEQFVADAIAEVNIPDVSEFITEADLVDYALKSELTGKSDINHTHPEYADKEHTHDEYLTEHQPLDNYYNKEEVNNLIPSLKGYATEQYVIDAIENHEALNTVEEVKTKLDEVIIPTVNDTILPTVEKVEAEILPTVQTLSVAKADNIPFITAKFVKNPVGSFVENENVSGLSIAELFAKLLGLVDEDPGNEDPEVPTNIVEYIIKNEIPMYSVTTDGALEKVTYNHLTLTEEEATAPATEPGFYQIKDAEGNVLESGYQEIQVENDEIYYVVALPKELNYDTMISVKAWNDLENCWTDTGADKPALICDADTVAKLCDEAGIDISHIDTSVYTIWLAEDFPNGSIYRFIIKE